MISQQENFPKTFYTTQQKLLYANEKAGYYNSTIPDPGFVSPYTQGKKNTNYVSPTFTSGDWYNQQKSTSTYPSVSPIRDNAEKPKLILPPTSPYEGLEEQYLKGRTYKISEKQEDDASTRKVSVTSSTLLTQRQSQMKVQSPDRRSKTPTAISKELNKFMNDGKSPRIKKHDNEEDFPQSVKSGVKTPISNYFKMDQSDRQTVKSSKLCPDCINKELIQHKSSQKIKQKEIDQDLIAKNIKEEQRKIQQEAAELLHRRELEQQVLRKGYQDHLDKQNLLKELKYIQYHQEKEYESQSAQKNYFDDSRSQEKYNKKRNDFIDGLKNQLKEKNIQKQVEQAIQQEQNKLPTSLQIGQEYLYGIQNLVNMKKQIDNQLLQNQNSIIQKNQAKQQEKAREKFYSDWMRSQNDKFVLQQTQEKQMENQRQDIFIQELNQQVLEKNRKKQIEFQKDHDFYNQMKLFDAQINQKKLESCSCCNKSVPKDYLTKLQKKIAS